MEKYLVYSKKYKGYVQNLIFGKKIIKEYYKVDCDAFTHITPNIQLAHKFDNLKDAKLIASHSNVQGKIYKLTVETKLEEL